MALWGGRFESGPDALFRAINDSLGFDVNLGRQDVRGSIEWANALQHAGVLTFDELRSLQGALNEIDAVLAANPQAPLGSGAEDIHTWVETELVKRVGALGKKLHTGRSRNDQVATDLRLWVVAQIDARREELRVAQRALLAIAEREKGTVFPGYTHLQRAQPVSFAHWALAYVEMFERDRARFADARRRAAVLPLGSGALAGTAYPIDRERLAKALGFESASLNSLDAVSDRDFVIETLAAAAICGVHLSRLGEDLVIYGSSEFGLVEFDDAVASGSSLMPQKKNPDAAELLRAKSGRLNGALMTLLTVVKGLPLAYNKDLQEDKEPIFDAMEHLCVCLAIVPRIMQGLTVRRDRALAAAQGGYSNATDLADYLVGRGVPFRDAHEQAGRLVRLALARNVALEALTLEDMRSIAPSCGPDVFAAIDLHAGAARRAALGGASPARVAEALAAARMRLESGESSQPARP